MTDSIHQTSTISPSQKWYVIALLLFILAPLSGFALCVYGIYHAFTQGVEFNTSSHTTLIETPGEYLLWGTSEPENVQVSVQNISTGKDLTITSIQHPMTETVKSDHKMYAISKIHIDKKGEYRVVIHGDIQSEKFRLRQSVLQAAKHELTLGFLLILLGIIGGPVIAVIVLIKRNNAAVTLPETQRIKTFEEQGRFWAASCHFSTFLGFIIPFANIIAPLIIWSIKKTDLVFVNEQGKEAINFQLSMVIYSLASILLIFVLVGLFLLPLLGIFNLIAVIIATIETAQGHDFRYPLCIRFLK